MVEVQRVPTSVSDHGTPAVASALEADSMAAAGGPIVAAARGLWALFAASAFAELVALVLIGQALWPATESGELRGSLAGGLVLLVLVRAGLALAVGPLGRLAERRRSMASNGAAGSWRQRAVEALAMLVPAYFVTLYHFVVPEKIDWLASFPRPASLDTSIAHAIDVGVDWMKLNWVDFFDALTAGLRSVLNFIELCFVGTPWPVVTLVVLVIAWRLAGPRVTIFTGASLAYLGLLGFWEKSMSTLALIATSVLICVVFGIPLGVWIAKSRRLRVLTEPIMDVMQTLPTFVYLIPAVAFFSIGKPPGVIATVIFALPPMVRLTELGIRQVPATVREAALAFGASPGQLLWKVELPLAMRSIRVGINQTIMMSLSMVVIAAMIGAGGLGLEVIRSLQHLKTGQGVLAGFAIVLCAMVLDRMVRGGEREENGRRRSGGQ